MYEKKYRELINDKDKFVSRLREEIHQVPARDLPSPHWQDQGYFP
jgi:hypothetical protein